MYDLLSDLAEYVDSLPAGTVLDGALKARLVARIMSIGKGEPMASTGSRYDELKARLAAKYPSPAGLHAGPAGPAGPASPHPPPAQSDE